MEFTIFMVKFESNADVDNFGDYIFENYSNEITFLSWADTKAAVITCPSYFKASTLKRIVEHKGIIVNFRDMEF